MGYLAAERLRWGDGWIDPGEPVPDEPGRNYAQMLYLGQIVPDSTQIAQPHAAQRQEPDALAERENESEPGEPDDGDDLPDGVVAIKGGWFQLPDGRKVRGRKALADALAERE